MPAGVIYDKAEIERKFFTIFCNPKQFSVFAASTERSGLDVDYRI